MFKNLIRLRLLDFFELTAAIGGALYVYQSGEWYHWEKTWVISALTVAAVIMWIATRLGKTNPTPGLFLAAYAGALNGLSDLSPWIVLFGRHTVIETAQSCFPASMPSRGWQERTMTIALLTCFMATPAIFFSCVWASLGQVLQLMRKKWEPPKSRWGAAAIACHTAVTVIFLAGLNYYWLRPQIRHVGTIRIPFDIPPDVKDWEMATPRSPYPRIWQVSSEGDLLILFSDMTLRRFDLSTHKVISERCLASPELPSSVSASSATAIDSSDLFVSMWSIAPGKLLLHRWTDKQSRSQPLEIHDLTAKGSSPSPVLFANGEPVMAISLDGKFVATTHSSSKETDLVTLVVYETTTGRRRNEVRRSKVTLKTESVGLDLEGNLQFESRFGDSFTVSVARRPFEWATSSPSVTEQRSTSGALRLTDRGLEHFNSKENILKEIWSDNLFVLLEPYRERVVLLGCYSHYPFDTGEDSALPIVEHLLHEAQSAQPTLYDCDLSTYSTSWLRRGLLRGDFGYPKPQFTPEGRFMIAQNHDRKAFLYHIFAMP